MDCQKIEILLGQRSILFKAKKANTWLEATVWYKIRKILLFT